MRSAAKGGHIEIVKKMLRLGAFDYKNSIVAAAASGNMELVNLILELGYSKNPEKNMLDNITSKDYRRAVLEAAEHGHLEIVKLMVEKDKSTRSPLDNQQNIFNDYEIAVIKAIENGHLEVVKFLLNLKIDYYYEDFLAEATSSDRFHIAKLILGIMKDKGIEIDYSEMKKFIVSTSYRYKDFLELFSVN